MSVCPSSDTSICFNQQGKTYCSYKLYLDKESSLTQIISNTINPDFGYIKRFAFSPVTKQFLDYLVNQPLIIEVWGKQVGRKVSKVQAPTKPSVQKPNAAPQLNVQTKRNVEIIHRSYSSNVAAQPQPSQQTANVESIPRSHSLTNDDRKHQLQLTKSIRRADRSDKKLKKIRELVEEAKKNKTTTLEVSVLEGILNGGEGDKFKATASVVMTTNKAAAENDGKITSSACVLQ